MNFCLPKINIYVKPDNKNKKEVFYDRSSVSLCHGNGGL